MDPQKLKRVVIKEEFVAITGNYVDAVLLAQLLYWSERVKDFDLFIQQEIYANRQNADNGVETPKQLFGWIYKSLRELSEETMLGLSPNAIKTHLKNLCDLGFISTRENKNKWDRRKEYKVNLLNIQKELFLYGYSLEGYTLNLPFAENANGFAENANGFANSANRTVKNCKTVTEITTENTTENKNTMSAETADADKNKFSEDSQEIKIVDFFIKKLKSINKNIKVPDTLSQKQRWAQDIDKILRLDKRDEREILNVISFAVNDDFWSSNILSTKALRKHYDKLLIKMQKNSGTSYKYNFVNETISETERMLEERRKERERVLSNG